jgi:uncharacterized protein with von Willebrand factor type A (vWA) domain
MIDQPAPDFLWTLFNQLRRRHFPLGPDDYEALREALRAGFGWSSREALRDLCCALWTKSKRERNILEALFDQADVPAWRLQVEERRTIPMRDKDEGTQQQEQSDIEMLEAIPMVEESPGGLPPISLAGVKLPERPFVFVPQFPLTYREVAQAWRRLRKPVRQGPPVELDVKATIDRRSRQGVATRLVLVPRRRNTARLLLLVDRGRSMAPFHAFVSEACAAIQQAGNLEEVALYYFDTVPAEGADETLLETLPNQLFPVLDPILPEIVPLKAGILYTDPALLSPQPLDKVLDQDADGAAVVVLSEAGAAQGHYDPLRLLDTVAFLKALGTYTTQYVWLNPLPRSYWANSTAAQIARHVPMLSLDQTGMYQAVNILRGQPYLIERPL